MTTTTDTARLLPDAGFTSLAWLHASYRDECPRCGGTTVGYSDGYQLGDRRLCIHCEPHYEYDRIEIRRKVNVWPPLEQARRDLELSEFDQTHNFQE